MAACNAVLKDIYNQLKWLRPYRLAEVIKDKMNLFRAEHMFSPMNQEVARFTADLRLQ